MVWIYSPGQREVLGKEIQIWGKKMKSPIVLVCMFFTGVDYGIYKGRKCLLEYPESLVMIVLHSSGFQNKCHYEWCSLQQVVCNLVVWWVCGEVAVGQRDLLLLVNDCVGQWPHLVQSWSQSKQVSVCKIWFLFRNYWAIRDPKSKRELIYQEDKYEFVIVDVEE